MKGKKEYAFDKTTYIVNEETRSENRDTMQEEIKNKLVELIKARITAETGHYSSSRH